MQKRETAARQAAIEDLKSGIATASDAASTSIALIRKLATKTAREIRDEFTTSIETVSARVLYAETVQISDQAAVVDQLNSISVSVGDAAAAAAAAQATIDDFKVVAATKDVAIAQEIVRITSRVGDATAAVTSERIARTSADEALASDILVVAASIGGFGALVTAEATARATADGFLAGRYVLKVGAGDVVTGMTITSETGAGTDISDVVFNATNFKVYNGTTGVAPFQVISGVVRITGSLVLAASDVGGLAATATDSDYSAVTGTKPPPGADVTLSAINGGLTITSGGLTLNGTPTIKSNGYSAGVSGWQIDGGGNAEFNSVTVRGNIHSGSGDIGGFTIAASSLAAGSGGTYVEFGVSTGIKIGGTAGTPGYSNTDVGFAVEPGTNSIFVSRASVFAASFNVNATGSLVTLRNNGNEVGTIGVTGSNTSFNTTSDLRLKTDIAPLGEVGHLIDQFELCSYEFKREPGQRFTGAIAQQFHTVFPEAVTPGDYGETIQKTWGMDWSKPMPLVLRELQSLRRRVALLEA